MSGPRRQAWSRVGFDRGRFRCPLATSCFVGQPLAVGALDGEVGPGAVVNAHGDPVGVPEIEFRQVAVEVGFADVLK